MFTHQHLEWSVILGAYENILIDTFHRFAFFICCCDSDDLFIMINILRTEFF